MAMFQLRCKDEELRAWHAMAREAGVPLSVLARGLLNGVVDPSTVVARKATEVPNKPRSGFGKPADHFDGWCNRCKRAGMAACAACMALAKGGGARNEQHL
jgi:hypothetical protein